MAKVDFNNMQDDSAYTSSNGNSDFSFFTLRNDNDEAIVRFMCDSTDDFEILTVHDIKVGDRFRKVNCIRDFRDPVENCPLCASGAKINQRFFIKMIQYDKTTDSAGNVSVTPKAVIWERSTAYAKTLKSYLDNYGPLSDVICKIIRHGKAGDMQTTYEIVPNLNKTIYRDEIYVKDPSLVNFSAFGSVVMDKTSDEIMQFQMTGQFPQRAKKEDSAEEPVVSVPTMNQGSVAPQAPMNQGYVPPQYNATAVPQYENYAAPSNEPPQQAVGSAPNTWGQPTPRTTMPWDNAGAQGTGGFERPRRY